MAPNQLKTTGSNDKVKLETMARIKSIPWADRINDFAVMVRVTAPPLNESPRAAVDLVAVLDISGSMAGARLESMKKAMDFVIDHLHPDDRLSIVPFDHNVRRVTELSVMSEGNRQIARAAVLALKENGGTDMGKGMQEAATILRERQPEEKTTRPGRIIFLSDGQDGSVFNQTISPEFPAETFGLDAGHDPEVLRFIADKTLGIYSYVNEDLEKIKSAFAQSIGGLTSITAMDLQIQLKTLDQGVTISSIESGSYPKSISSDGGSGTISVNDLYAGEQKNFIVFLTVPEGKKKLMTVGGCYRNPKISNGSSIPLDDSEVAVKRPRWNIFSEVDTTVNPAVAAELARLQLVKGVSDIEKNKQPAGDMLVKLWGTIRGSEDGRLTPEPILAKLDKEVANMKKEGGDKKFMLSWLTSHLWQRATTKGSPSESSAFQTTEMVNNVCIAENKQKPVPVTVTPTTTPENKIIFNPKYCAFACIALLLLAGALFLHITRPVPPVPVPVIDDEPSTSPVDISKNEGWLKVQESLEVVMLKKMQDAGITSLLHGASAEYMSHTTSRYLLLALVHASVLGSRCNSAPTIALLEQKVERLEAEKLELSVKIESLAQETETEEEEETRRIACKDNEQALERANTRIAELEQQLQNKKAFADSLMSEVANADAHLKACNQRADILEAKVRDMEGTVAGQ